MKFLWIPCLFIAHICAAQADPASPLPSVTKIGFNNPGLVVDLGVGLWAQPLPMDFDGDGDNDLVVATADVPSNGIYFFENPEGDVPFPTFKPGVRLGDARHNITLSSIQNETLVMTPGNFHPDFSTTTLLEPFAVNLKPGFPFERTRANQWTSHDFNGDGRQDIVIGLGVWDDYGWDDAYNDQGEWTNGPLHGYVYVALNLRRNTYAEPERILAGAKPLDVYGAPSPNLADWDNDGDLDLICGSFLDTLTYFENIGTRTEPRYAEGRPLSSEDAPIAMDLQMLQVAAIDWDKDNDIDLIVGQEDGRVALVQNTGEMKDETPVFLPPRFFQQTAEDLKVGALCTPYAADWDGDGDEDLIVGDTAGYISFVENLDGGNPPRWAAPEYLSAEGSTIRIQAGKNGSIQGPCEAKWGYTVPSVADWNHDGLLDIVVNSIWGEVLWYENIGSRKSPELAMAKPIVVEWAGVVPKPEWFWWTPSGNQLVTQWRTSPMVVDLNRDGLNDLVMLDREGYLAYFERVKREDGLMLLPGRHRFLDAKGDPLQLNERPAGKSGRRKLALVDWDGDGRLDLLANGKNIDLWRNISTDNDEFRFENMGPLAKDKLAGHTTCPAIVDWNNDAVPDLLIGAEDGFFYHLENPRGIE